ncbi:MAG: flavin reductase family protein [Pseudomonadota bacterium]
MRLLDMAKGESFRPETTDPKAFRNALGRYATGVTVITCATPEGPVGITVNSFASVSLDPPLVLWSPAKGSKRCEIFVNAEHFAIHVLGESQKGLCDTFAAVGGRDFSAVEWQPGAHGVPLLKQCLACFECERYAVHPGGDHEIILGKVTKATVGEGAPLVFVKGGYGRFEEME